MNLYQYHTSPDTLDGYRKLDSEILDLGNGISIPSVKFEDDILGTEIQEFNARCSKQLKVECISPTIKDLQYIFMNRNKLYGVVSKSGNFFIYNNDYYWTGEEDLNDPDYKYLEMVGMYSGRIDYDTDHYRHFYRPIIKR